MFCVWSVVISTSGHLPEIRRPSWVGASWFFNNIIPRGCHFISFSECGICRTVGTSLYIVQRKSLVVKVNFYDMRTYYNTTCDYCKTGKTKQSNIYNQNNKNKTLEFFHTCQAFRNIISSNLKWKYLSGWILPGNYPVDY